MALAQVNTHAYQDALPYTDWNIVAGDLNYLVVPGSAVAALGGSNTLTITNNYHSVTVAGGNNVDNISYASAVAGQRVILTFANAQTLRNAGGGGNIRTISGANYLVASSEMLEFVFDGTYWWLLDGKSPGWSQSFDVVSASTLQTIFTQSIAGNLLGALGSLDIVFESKYTNNTGSNKNLLVQVSFGGTIMWGSTVTALSTSTTNRSIRLNALLSNENATNVQQLGGMLSVGGAVNGGVAGIGDIGQDFGFGTIGGAAAVDTTTAQTLLVQVQHNANSANLEIKGTVHVLYRP